MLTPVGLLPVAVAGIDIRALLYGAVSECRQLAEPDQNAAIEYASLRCLLHESGYTVEALSTFDQGSRYSSSLRTGIQPFAP